MNQLTPMDRLYAQRYDDKIQDEVRTAAGFLQQYPDLTRSEALRLAHDLIEHDDRGQA